jgi:hypothetical protein
MLRGTVLAPDLPATANAPPRAPMIDFVQTVHQAYSVRRRHFVRQNGENCRDCTGVYMTKA